MYADAGRREGLTVDAAFIHDLGAADRHSVPVDQGAVAAAECVVVSAAEALAQRDLTPAPERSKCRVCESRVCAARLS